MSKLDLFIVGFGRPDLLRHQKRLLDRFLKDDFGVCVVDNTPGDMQLRMQQVCADMDMGYMRAPETDGEHPTALNHAAAVADEIESEFWGTLDHDIFLTKRYTVIPKIKKSGFYGVGQTYKPRVGDSVKKYLWPGWSFWSREWLNGRIPDFNGIRDKNKWDDGDCGSMLHGLFSIDDCCRMTKGTHGYGTIRPEDEHGLQSFGFEWFDDCWLHLTNASHWKAVPKTEERDALFLDMLGTM